MRKLVATVIAAGVLALAGCSHSAEPPLPAPATPAAEESATPTPTPTPEPEEGPYKIGKQVRYEASGITLAVQAIAYKQLDRIDAPLDEYKASETWGIAEVRTCVVANNSGEKVTVSQFPWHLNYSDGTSIDVTGNTGGNLPKPEYPMDKVLKVGRCARGKITFVVPKKDHPEFLTYSPDDAAEEGSTGPVDWKV